MKNLKHKLKYKLLALLIVVAATPAHAFDPCNFGEEMFQEKYTPIFLRYEKGLIFSIEKCGVPKSYIMGTIHTDNPEVIDKISHAFDLVARSNSASFETKFFGEDITEQLKASYYPETSVKTLKDSVGSSLYEKYSRILAKDYPEFNDMVYFRMRPWAAAMILQYPQKTGSGKVMDEQLQEFASSRGVEVHGIESGKELISFFTDMSAEEALEFFEYSVNNYDSQQGDIKKLTDAYLGGSIEDIYEIARKSIIETKRAGILKGFEQKLIIDRNKKMVERTGPYLKKGRAFIAVGALHLPGDEGILKLLEEKGYYINVVKSPEESFEESLR